MRPASDAGGLHHPGAEGRGTGAPEDIARDAAAIALEGATPTAENAYKIKLAERSLHAALIDAMEQTA